MTMTTNKPKWAAAVDRAMGTLATSVKNETLSSSEIRKGTELFEWMTGGFSSAGMAVSEQSSMRVSAVYACVNLIGGAIASLPLPVYQNDGEGRQRIDHDYSKLLNNNPHPQWSSAVFREFMVASLLLNGDAFALINRAGGVGTKAVSLEPLHKSRVEVKRDGTFGRLYYLKDESGKVIETKTKDDIIHIPGPGFDGLNGMSQIRHALRNSVGIALAADEYSGAFFKNGARPDFALEFPGDLTKEQQDMIRSTWAERHQGAANSNKPALLSGGAKVHELTMKAEDAQLIGTRHFQVEDIARVFGVPPHMIGHTEKSTSWGSGIEQMSIGFVKYTLQRHLVKIEQELNRKLFTSREDERRGVYCEFNTSGLERGDYKTRNEGYRIALGRAGEPSWMTVNEVRKLENLPPIDGGDTLASGGSDAVTQ